MDVVLMPFVLYRCPWRGLVPVDMWPLAPSVSQHINRRCTLPPYTIGRSKRIVSMQQIDDQWTRSSTSQQGQTTTTHDCSGGFFVDNHVKVDWVVPDGSETHKSVNLLVRPKLTSERTPGQKRGGISCVVKNFWRIGEDQRKERIRRRNSAMDQAVRLWWCFRWSLPLFRFVDPQLRFYLCV